MLFCFSAALLSAGAALASEDGSAPATEDSAPGGAVDVEEDGALPWLSPAQVTVLPLGPGLAPGQDVATVLDRAAGASARYMGGMGGFSAISVRGSPFRQVELFLDDVPLNPDGAQAVDLSEFPPSAFDRVELWRGNAPLETGSAAMGGVVVLRTPPESPTHLAMTGGSWGTWRMSGLAAPSVMAGPVPVEVFLSADQLHTDGDWPWYDDQGTEFNHTDDRTEIRSHNALDRQSLIGRVQIRFPGLSLSLLDSFSSLRQDLSGPTQSEAEAANFSGTRNLLALQARKSVGFGELRPLLWWVGRRQVLDDRAGEVGVGAEWREDRLWTGGGQVFWQGMPDPALTIRALLRGRAEGFVPTDLLGVQTESASEQLRRRQGAALGASVGWTPVDRLSVEPQALLEYLDNRLIGTVPFEHMPVAPEGEDQQLIFLPRLGARLGLLSPARGPGLALKGTAGRSWRPPDMTELFGGQGTLVGNTDLLPERAWYWDAGVLLGSDQRRTGGPAVEAEFAWAERWSRDMIVYVQNSQYTRRAENVGMAWIRSVEGGLRLALPCRALLLESGTSGSLLLSRNLVPAPGYADNALPGLAPWEVSEQLDLSLQTRAGWSALRLGWGIDGAGPIWYDSRNLQQGAPRWTQGARLALAPSPRLPALSMEIRNLLDARGMAVPLDPLHPALGEVVEPRTDFAGYPLPGRTFFVSLRWTEPQRETNLKNSK